VTIRITALHGLIDLSDGLCRRHGAANAICVGYICEYWCVRNNYDCWTKGW